MVSVLIAWLLVGLFTPRRKHRRPPDPVEPKPGREAYTVPEAAWVLNCSVGTVWGLLASRDGHEPELPSFKLGRKRLIARRALEEFMERGTARRSVRRLAAG